MQLKESRGCVLAVTISTVARTANEYNKYNTNKAIIGNAVVNNYDKEIPPVHINRNIHSRQSIGAKLIYGMDLLTFFLDEVDNNFIVEIFLASFRTNNVSILS